MQFEIAQVSSAGNRSANQDRLGAVETRQGVLLALADGLGGRAGGELAAQTLVDTAREAFNNSGPIADPSRFLLEVVRRAHSTVLQLAPDAERPPGTTAVLCLLRDGLAHWAHVGDSRLYLFRDGRTLFRTRDHSYVEKLYREGAIRRNEMAHHPLRNQITQCIGAAPRQPEVALGRPYALQPGDVLLLCSDGFWSPLTEAAMAEAVRAGHLAEVIEGLAYQAETTAAPHSDNVSAIALRYLADQPQPRPVRLSEGVPADEELRRIERLLREYMDEIDREGS